MQLLNLNQSLLVSGGTKPIEFFPDPIPGCVLVGWEQVLDGFDITTSEKRGWFTTTILVEKTPLYTFKPIFDEL